MAGEVDRFKNGFFDRKAVIAIIGQAAASGMMRTGGYVRKVSRNSMKKKKGPSAPGSPPHVHSGELKKLLYFAFDYGTKSMVIGPVGFKGSDVPRVLEFGGRGIAARPYMRPAMVASLPRLAPSIKFGR